jgi:biotin carboxyl carrier protein
MMFDNLQELIDLLDEAPSITEISIGAAGGEQITIKRPPSFTQQPLSTSGARISDFVGEPQSEQEYEPVGSTREEEPGNPGFTPPLIPINANRVGVFHTAKPRIEIGDKVTSGQVVGFIESIKLMNEIRSEVEGILVEQLLDEGTPVEYGQQIYSLSSTIN